MKRIREPFQLVPSADMVELVEHWESNYLEDALLDEMEIDAKYRHNWHKAKAAKNLRKFNRRTLSN